MHGGQHLRLAPKDRQNRDRTAEPTGPTVLSLIPYPRSPIPDPGSSIGSLGDHQPTLAGPVEGFMNRLQWTSLLLASGIALIAIATLAAFALRFGPFADDPGPALLNRLNIDFALCPPDLVVVSGTNLYRACREPVASLDVQVSSGDIETTLSAIQDEVAVDDLPNGAIQLHVDGVAAGTVDILSCRSYAQDEQGLNLLMTLVPPIAYASEPMTASIIAQPYIITGWPDNRWQATAADPTSDQLAEQPSVYGTVFRCNWFLLPPGSLSERPGLVRSWTATDYLGEPAIHVLGPGGGGDASSPSIDTADPPLADAFDFRSTTDGSLATTGDSWIDHYVLSPGTWVISDRTTGRQALVDVAPGQTSRVVSVSAIEQLATGTPASTPQS